MNDGRERHGAARMFLSLAGDQAAAEHDQMSPARKAGMLFLVLLFVAATPMYWVGTAFGHDGSDAPVRRRSRTAAPAAATTKTTTTAPAPAATATD